MLCCSTTLFIVLALDIIHFVLFPMESIVSRTFKNAQKEVLVGMMTNGGKRVVCLVKRLQITRALNGNLRAF